MSKTYSAGIVTAYGAAKRAGYTGTYEDFCRQQAGYAENAAAVEQAKTDAINAKNDAVNAKNTAVSAKNDAVSAKDDAVSAKNTAVSAKNTATTKAQEAGQSATSAGLSATSASQSAQNAEQSAQGVSGSLAQIQTNKEDIDELKADLDDVIEEIGLYIPPETSGTTEASSAQQTIISNTPWVNGHSYTITFTITEATDVPIYIYAKSTSGNLTAGTLSAGSTTVNKTFTASADDANGFINANTGGKSVSYTVKVVDNNISQSTRIDNALSEIASVKAFTGETPPISFTDKTYISTPSVGATGTTEQTTLNGCASAYVACSKGDIFTLYGTPRNNSGTRAYAWLKSSKLCVYRYDDTAVIDGLVISAPFDGYLVLNFSTSADYAVYRGVRNLGDKVVTNIKDIATIKQSPLESLPEYMTNAMSYHPLGQLSKPYLCLSCDDGSAELESYTIPMLLTKDVPCTFGLWSTKSKTGESPVFSESVVLRTQSGIDAVLSAIANGCEVAQHGTVEWTELTEAELNDFFDREEAAFEALGIEVKGAICPSHCVNNKVRVIAGGRFGSVRSGYNGFKSKADQQGGIPGDVLAPYGSLTGARSNCYSYTSFNTIDKTLAELKTMLDNAISNNMCMIVYWHDWDLTTEQKTTLEAFIDYAKTTTVTFTTLSKIPRLA